MKLVTTEQTLKNKSDQYEELLQENHALQKKLNEDSSSLRVELRFKEEEIMKLTNQYEEQLHNYKEAQIEALALKEKLDILRMEYYKLESSSRQHQADIRAENAMFKERLKNYEQIEQELDQAIVQASEGGVASDLGNALASAIAHAPTTAKRRIQQSLILSNKLLEKQKEMEELGEKLKETRRENEKLAEEVQMYKRLSEKTNQPYSYLTVGIEKAEKELYLAQKENKNKAQTIDNLKKEVESLREVSS
jgi:chromosome segregation ATPase